MNSQQGENDARSRIPSTGGGSCASRSTGVVNQQLQYQECGPLCILGKTINNRELINIISLKNTYRKAVEECNTILKKWRMQQ